MSASASTSHVAVPDAAHRIVLVDATFDWGDDFAIERQAWAPLGTSFTVTHCKTEEEIVAAAKDAGVIVYMGLYTPLNARVLPQLPECRMIIRYGIGVDSVDHAVATELGIIVANTAEYCVPEVADHAAALLLGMTRRIVFLDRFVHAGNWARSNEIIGPVPRLSTLTLGLVGMGRIGRQVAQKMKAFVGSIIAHDPYLSQADADRYGVELVSLNEVMSRSDMISLHTPLTPETRGLIGAAELALMKPDAVIVNTSRGPVIQEAALIEVLQARRIAGAALDVVESEPLPAQSPLLTLDNVILTPHFAAYSIQSLEDMRVTIAQSVANVVQGMLPPHVVNKGVVPRFPLRAPESH